MKLIIFRELLWLFVALTTAFLLSLALRLLLQTDAESYSALVAELGGQQAVLQLVLYVLCLVGIYVSRLAVAAVGSFADSQTTT